MAKDQRADEDALLPLAQHGVPHGGGVARRVDAQPRPRRVALAGGDARVDELMLGGHPTG
ncbi:MAG: hypothetical protein AVDCRST_MAG13-121 [uncultured Solirubrobacteraceae bacterium]|uniref:Uncharacterized protein n=1 Tax=uncultured Solirubrobacteraceae bacterium TaxID=1162706 RepID=A0A6J4R9S1_9ACTN|nr:MAG: hypothetical protein AVDCRST_MAG13-121 [uncultured Solirubrobacteraceae bacterium]